LRASYSKTAAIEITQQPVKGGKTYTMFDALVAAKLNAANGCPSCKISDTIRGPNLWMCKYEIGSDQREQKMMHGKSGLKLAVDANTHLEKPCIRNWTLTTTVCRSK